MRKQNVYEENGVVMSKSSLKPGDTVRLAYNGLLKSSGANQVKVHLGYNDNWESCATLDMLLVDDQFVADISILEAGTFNCAFVDLTGNWDNNSGVNYSFKVSKTGSTKPSKPKAPKAKKEKAEENDKKRIKSA